MYSRSRRPSDGGRATLMHHHHPRDQIRVLISLALRRRTHYHHFLAKPPSKRMYTHEQASRPRCHTRNHDAITCVYTMCPLRLWAGRRMHAKKHNQIGSHIFPELLLGTLWFLRVSGDGKDDVCDRASLFFWRIQGVPDLDDIPLFNFDSGSSSSHIDHFWWDTLCAKEHSVLFYNNCICTIFQKLREYTLGIVYIVCIHTSIPHRNLWLIPRAHVNEKPRARRADRDYTVCCRSARACAHSCHAYVICAACKEFLDDTRSELIYMCALYKRIYLLITRHWNANNWSSNIITASSGICELRVPRAIHPRQTLDPMCNLGNYWRMASFHDDYSKMRFGLE